MSAHLELFAAFLVDMRRAVNRELLDPRRKRDRSAHIGTGTLGSRHDLPRRIVKDPMIKRLEANADVLTVHGLPRCKSKARPTEPAAQS